MKGTLLGVVPLDPFSVRPYGFHPDGALLSDDLLISFTNDLTIDSGKRCLALQYGPVLVLTLFFRKSDVQPQDQQRLFYMICRC